MKAILKQAILSPVSIKIREWAWFLAFLFVLVAAPQVFAEVTASTHPQQVTVYPNGARVTREGTLQLSAGDQQVVFPDLPASLIESSLHLSVEGPAGTKLYGVSMRKEYTPQVVEGRTRRIKNRIQALEDQGLTYRIRFRRAKPKLPC